MRTSGAERPNLTSNTWTANLFLWVSHAFHPKATEPQRCLILAVLLFLCLHRLTQNVHVRQGNAWGRCVFLVVSHASHPKVAEPHCSLISEVLLYLCLHPLMQNVYVRQGSTWGRGVFLGVSRASPKGLLFVAMCNIHSTIVSRLCDVTVC